MKLLILLLVSTTTLFSQIPFPQDTIARNDKFNNRMFPAYDSQGKIHLSYTGQTGTDAATREIYYVKEESNGSFSTVNVTNNFVDDNYSTLSIDADDKIHIGFIGRDGANLFQVQYTNNINGSFFTPVFITAGGLNKATPFTKVGPDSIVHFVFFTFTNDPDNIFYTKYDLRDSSIQLTPTLLAAGETGGDFDAALDVDSQGKVHVVMKTGGAFGGPFKYMVNNGGVWNEIQTGIAGNITNPKVTIDRNDFVHIIYRLESDLRMYYTNNTGGSFSTPVAITPPGQRPSFAQNFALDDSNRVYVVYQSSVTASGRGFYFVYADQGVFSDTLLIYNLSSEYVTRNSSAVIAHGNGDMALFYAPGGVRNSVVICDIFMNRGSILQIIPVELTSFTASVSGSTVNLNWMTATELNNSGFTIERRNANSSYEQIGFVQGKGTTSEHSFYSFADKELAYGTYNYRLKQIDFDGTFSYSSEVEVEVGLPFSFSLEQNHPNPFNPATIIKFAVPKTTSVKLSVYNTLGEEVAVLVNGVKEAGYHSVEWNGNNYNNIKLPSGVYIYRIESPEYNSSKKMIMLK